MTECLILMIYLEKSYRLHKSAYRHFHIWVHLSLIISMSAHRHNYFIYSEMYTSAHRHNCQQRVIDLTDRRVGISTYGFTCP